jgi:hypothetical protein
MATALGRLQISVYDNQGNKGSWLTHVTFDDGQTAAQLSAEIATFATALRTVSTAGITLGSFDVVNRAIAVAPAADANLPSGATFDFSNAANPSVYGNWVPSFLDSLVSAGGHIDITSGAALAWANLMINSGAGPYNPANTQYVANLAALNAFRSDRKRKHRVR